MAKHHRSQIIKDVVADLETLPEDRLEEVRYFVESLTQKLKEPRRGSPEALLGSFGRWDGPEGELEKLVSEIYQARHEEEEVGCS